MPKNDDTYAALLKRTTSEFVEDDCPTMAAALAYYTAFSLPPLLVLVTTVAGWIWSPEAVTGRVEEQVRDILGDGGWHQVETMMTAASEKTRGGVAAIIGVVALLFGATGVMVQLQAALNRAWEVEPDPKAGGVRNLIFKRMLSLAMILAVAFLLIVSLALAAVLNAAGGAISGWLGEGIAGWAPASINFIVNLVVFALLFAAMFKWLPDATVAWSDTLIGASATAALFMIGKYALSLYFARADAATYGAAASILLLLLWAYYSGMIFLFGAEFTQVWARRRGAGIVPQQGAAPTWGKTASPQSRAHRAS